jgi:hypothetical protein
VEMKRESYLIVEVVLSIDVELELVVYISSIFESKKPNIFIKDPRSCRKHLKMNKKKDI